MPLFLLLLVLLGELLRNQLEDLSNFAPVCLSFFLRSLDQNRVIGAESIRVAFSLALSSLDGLLAPTLT